MTTITGVHRSVLAGTGIAAAATLLLYATAASPSWKWAWQNQKLAGALLSSAAMAAFILLPYASLARLLASLRPHPKLQLTAFFLVAGTGVIGFGWLWPSGHAGGWAFLLLPFLQMVELLLLGWFLRIFLALKKGQ